jgi:drug/metabolite transporter (DMT)-like permease
MRARMDLGGFPRDLKVAGAVGLGVGAFAAGTAYYFYATAGGPTLPGVAVIPLSLLVVAVAYVVLVRRRMPRASDWLALGYTAAVVLASTLLMLWEAARELYAEMNVAVW